MRHSVFTTHFAACCFGLTILMTPMLSAAQSFSAVVSPPRFEVVAQPGKTTRQVFEITQASNDKGNYRLYTNDWTIGADGNAIFTDELALNSCRPWVSIERREVAIAGNAKIRFRFEITPPADAAATECRFAIMIEGAEQVVKATDAMSFPVSGRMGIVVYATVGDASPKLDIAANGTRIVDGLNVPVLNIKNTGNAHARPVGFLKGVDHQGQKIDFTPEPLPILPGQTRAIALVPQFEGATTIKLVYPLTIKGAVEWSDAPGSKKTDIDFRFDGKLAGPSLVASPLPPPPLAPATPATASKASPNGSGVVPK